jgi:shikimate dehydrogenase
MSRGAAGNPTVAMVEAAFRHHGLNWRYVNMEVAPEDLAAAVAGARAMGFRGFNLSIPHKVAVIPLLDGLGESAGLMRAVNCVVRRDGRWIGENTDGKGFLKSLREVAPVEGSVVTLLGAGGAARAIAVELALAGAARLRVVNRDPGRGRELSSLISENTACAAGYHTWDGAHEIDSDTGILINATPAGLYDADAMPAVALSSLRPSVVVADVVFNPPRTRLLREAERIGCPVVDGLGMLVNQGVIGVEYWTGVSPDPAVMRAALETALGIAGPA